MLMVERLMEGVVCKSSLSTTQQLMTLLTKTSCGDPAHFQRDCPDKPPNDGKCFNCGEEGHSKAECTNERVEREFTGMYSWLA